MKSLKTLLLAFIICLGTGLVNPKKANSGIILTAASGGIGLGVGLGVGIPLITVGAVFGTFGTVAHIALNGSIALPIVAGVLFVLDENEAAQADDSFKTIPGYIFDDIELLGEARANSGTIITDKVTDIILTDDEVDELFIATDSSVNPVELDRLRNLLTNPSFIEE